MNSLGPESVYVLAGPMPLAGPRGEPLRALLEACRANQTGGANRATVVLGIGPPDRWQQDLDWLSPDARALVWFDHLVEPEDYQAALERLPHASFHHGSQGIDAIRRVLIGYGILPEPPQVDAAGVDALFSLQGDYLQRLRRDFEEFLAKRPEGEPALSAAWRAFLQRVEGSAGTYEFSAMTEAAQSARQLFHVVPPPAEAEPEAVRLLGDAIDGAIATHRDQAIERLPTRIELDVRYRVLVLTDDDAVARQFELALHHSRISVEAHSGAHTLPEALRLVQPDVLVIQQSLRHFDGLDLAAQLRDVAEYAALPIVALLHDASESTRNRAARCGVDSWLVRPFSAESAVLSVLNILRRREAEQALGGRDPITRLYSRSALEDRLELELLRARRSGELVGLLVVHIGDDSAGRYPRQALLQLSQVVEATFRRSDILGRYNERTIACVLPGADPRVVLALTQRLQDSLDPSITIACAASIAEGAVSPQMVMADAETRLVSVLEGQPASAIGRVVHRANEAEEATQAPRILLVDSDEAILTLLRFFCAREGLQVDEARDGLAAIEYLDRAGRSGQLPDLVVLEAYLPGVDGFSVLRKIHAEYGARVSVMMLTVQRNEERIAKAFKLGAADFVAKPFSVPEVMARIKNILVRSGAL